MTSILGGQKIEGVVIKPSGYDLYGADKKVLMGKYVSEAYKEIHKASWKVTGNADIIELLGSKYRTPARWQKAVQHIGENGELEGSVRDIGRLVEEVPKDILKEEEEEIKDALFKWAWNRIRRETVRGLAEWYKQQLMEKQFEGEGHDSDQAGGVSGDVGV